MDIVIIGVGHFGSALAQTYENQGARVFRIGKTDPWPQKAELVLLCVPTQNIPEVWSQRGAALKKSKYVISAAKGLIKNKNQTVLEFLQPKLGRDVSALALSGPSFASELMAGQPTALVLAGRQKKIVDMLAQKLSTPKLRLYKSTDPHGVELCGALKNVYAIAAGIAEGLGFQNNTRAALITRSLAELTRVGQALGGKPITFFGLAGVGDLVLTCSSLQSRNFKFGHGLSQGKSIPTLLEELETIEGLWTASVAQKICKKKKIRAPLIDSISAILEGRLDPKDAITHLMTRELRHEFD